jgi:hypothetical protein
MDLQCWVHDVHDAISVVAGTDAEGPERLSRGQAYFRRLSGRDFHQHVWLVSGVPHSGERMLDSPCGVAAMFEGRCDGAASRTAR